MPHGLRYAIVALLILGICFRIYHLDYKVYWIDETYTSLRLSGYTRSQLVDNILTGQVIGVDTLQHYQHLNPEKNILDTVKSIAAEEPQLAPLYFILVRIWAWCVGDSVAGVRSFSVMCNLLAIPCLGWLCRELFASSLTTGVAIALFAITPLQVLYAQEARPYSLWITLTLLSSAVLLWALRTQTRRSWIVYGLTVACGLYTHCIFSLVALAHGVYVLLIERAFWRWSRTTIAYLLSTAIAVLAFAPWLVLIISNLHQATNISAFAQDAHSFSQLLDWWFANANRALLGKELHSFNFALVLLIFYALYWLCRTTAPRVWLFVLLLVGVPFLALALPDLLLGGGRSLRIRYIIPAYLGIQLALAYLFADRVTGAARGQISRWRWLSASGGWRVLLMVFVTGSLIACCAIAQASSWWSKGETRSAYYIPVAHLINQAAQPLVIGDDHPIDLLGLSYRLDPDVKFQLVRDPEQLTIAQGFSAIFLLNPTLALRDEPPEQHYGLQLIYRDPYADKGDEASERDRLWRLYKSL